MQRYEYVKGTHSKFWTIDRTGSKLTTSWGRIGTAGQSKTKPFASEALAEKGAEKLIAAKTRAGYQAVDQTAAGTASKPAATPKGSLSTLELWALGEALLGKDDRKLSSRVDFMWTAARGGSLPSKSGQLRIGDAEHHKASVILKGAPGSGLNPLFTVNATIDGKEVQVKGVRLRAALPVAWKAQRPLRIRRQRPLGGRGTSGIWTRGMTPKVLKGMGGFTDGKSARALRLPASDDRLAWVLGLDAKGEVVCVVSGWSPEEMFAAGADPIGTPSEAELAALRAAPHRHAIPAADLLAFGEAIRKHAVKRPPKSKQKLTEEWVEVRPFSKKLELSFCTTPDGVLPSARGELCFGNFAEPRSAIRIKGGNASNVIMTVEHHVYEYILVDERTTFHQTLRGVRLSNEVPVRWQAAGELTTTKAWRSDDMSGQCYVGFWTPGIERTSVADFDGKSYVGAHPGVFKWVVPVNTPLAWVVGFDAKDRPACVLVADISTDSSKGAYRFADYFDLGREALSGRGAGKAVRASKAAARAAIAEAAAAEAAAHPLTPATRAELDAIAAAIAAGPARAKKRITKRFSLDWDNAAIPSVEGELRVGDPNGADFGISVRGDEPASVFFFNDEENEAAAGWGRAVLGLRLGDGKAVQWKPSFGMGVDSGRYGVWSPGFPTEDVDDGVNFEGSLAAKIQPTAEGDCAFPSLLGLDAAKQPVAFLFGEALRLEVFKLARK